MQKNIRVVMLSAGLVIGWLQVPVIAAGQSKQLAVTQAPIPTQIVTAKKVFIANAGEDQPFNEDPVFNGGSERSYNQFYAGVKALGRYELVGAPADADLLFEIQFASPVADEKVGQKSNLLGPVPYDPRFRLEIRDPKANALLWVFTEHVPWAILQGNRDKNFDQGAERIVSDVQGLAVRASAMASNAKP